MVDEGKEGLLMGTNQRTTTPTLITNCKRVYYTVGSALMAYLRKKTKIIQRICSYRYLRLLLLQIFFLSAYTVLFEKTKTFLRIYLLFLNTSEGEDFDLLQTDRYQLYWLSVVHYKL